MTQLSHREWETLSSYLDGQLTHKEQQNLEAKLALKADWRAGLEELRRTRAIVRAHVPIRAPRNFTLTPEMAGVKPRTMQPGRLLPAMRLVATFSSFLFVLVVAGELFLGSRPVAAPMMQAETALEAVPAAESLLVEPETAMKADTQEQEVAAPPAEIARALEASSPPMEAPLAAVDDLVLTETSQGYEPGVGMGGGDGSGEQQDQEAFSAMEPALTATPLPTATTTPTATPAPTPTIQPQEEMGRLPALPGQTTLRWIEAILALVSITTASIAFYLYRSSRA